MTWPAMMWIGGAPGAGKSTIARDLARRTDLPLHPVDLWTYAHPARLEGLLARDAVLAELVRREAAERGRVLIEVSAEPDWAGITRPGRAAAVPLRVRVRDVRLYPYLVGNAGRVRRTAWRGVAGDSSSVLKFETVAVLQFHVRVEAPADL